MNKTYTEMIINFRPITELIPTHWQSGEVSLSDGGKVHYLRTGGNKPSIILLHGFQVDGRMWLRTALSLEPDYDVIMPDIRGHGLSSSMPLDLNVETLSDDIVTLMEALRLSEAPVIVGHSMGADIAVRLAAKANVKAIVLVDPALVNIMKLMPPMGDTLPDYMQPIVETIHRLTSLSHTERMIAGMNLLPPGAQNWNEYDYVTFVEGQSRFDVDSFKHATAMGYVVESPEVIAQIGCPITLLTARQMMMQAEQFENAVKIFTDNWQSGQHLHFEDSGHFIPFDQFERFINSIKSNI